MLLQYFIFDVKYLPKILLVTIANFAFDIQRHRMDHIILILSVFSSKERWKFVQLDLKLTETGLNMFAYSVQQSLSFSISFLRWRGKCNWHGIFFICI